MDFELTLTHRTWRDAGTALGQSLAPEAGAADVVAAAAGAGLLDPAAGLLAVALAVESLASESPAAAMVLALHTAGALSVTSDEHAAALFRGHTVAALTLATDEVPIQEDSSLSGTASWVAPITDGGIAVIGARREGALTACVVELDDRSLQVERIPTAALGGLVCGHLTMTRTHCQAIGPTLPVMARARVLIAAVGVGLGRRAVRESLGTVRGSRGAGGEQTVQGLVADAATELDAAALLSWKAATSPLSLATASMAKLAAVGAAQRAVERATQAVGADSFRSVHIIGRLAQDVRALELFAGRTEALREAVAEVELPHT